MAFFTDPQGRVRPVTQKRRTGPGTVVAVLALALALGGGGMSTGGLGSSGSAPSGSVSARTADGKQAARRGKADDAWRRMRARDVRRHVERAAECAAHSYGEVRAFFVRTPCQELRRALFGMTDEAGNRIVLSVSWV